MNGSKIFGDGHKGKLKVAFGTQRSWLMRLSRKIWLEVVEKAKK